jgi:hypothetical protein
VGWRGGKENDLRFFAKTRWGVRWGGERELFEASLQRNHGAVPSQVSAPPDLHNFFANNLITILFPLSILQEEKKVRKANPDRSLSCKQ